MMNDSPKFIAMTETGEEVECEVICTFESPETNKNYIVYTDNCTDENGNIEVRASVYEPNADSTDLFPIETQEEWEMIENVILEIQKAALEMEED